VLFAPTQLLAEWSVYDGSVKPVGQLWGVIEARAQSERLKRDHWREIPPPKVAANCNAGMMLMLQANGDGSAP
jgi:hypothetical protein